MAIIEKAPRSATCQAKEASAVFVLKAADFYRLMDEQAGIAIKIMNRMLDATADRSIRSSEFLSDMVRWGDEARKRAVVDGLTGLFNRRFLDEALRDGLQKARAGGHPLSPDHDGPGPLPPDQPALRGGDGRPGHPGPGAGAALRAAGRRRAGPLRGRRVRHPAAQHPGRGGPAPGPGHLRGGAAARLSSRVSAARWSGSPPARASPASPSTPRTSSPCGKRRTGPCTGPRSRAGTGPAFPA